MSQYTLTTTVVNGHLLCTVSSPNANLVKDTTVGSEEEGQERDDGTYGYPNRALYLRTTGSQASVDFATTLKEDQVFGSNPRIVVFVQGQEEINRHVETTVTDGSGASNS